MSYLLTQGFGRDEYWLVGICRGQVFTVLTQHVFALQLFCNECTRYIALPSPAPAGNLRHRDTTSLLKFRVDSELRAVACWAKQLKFSLDGWGSPIYKSTIVYYIL